MGGIVKGVGKAVGGLFGMSAPKMPTPEPAPVAPVNPAADELTLMQARRRAAADLQRRSGRQSTILTEGGGSNKLGG